MLFVLCILCVIIFCLGGLFFGCVFEKFFVQEIFPTVSFDVTFCEVPVLYKVPGYVFGDQPFDFDGYVSPWHSGLLERVDQAQVMLIHIGEVFYSDVGIVLSREVYPDFVVARLA